MIPHQRAQYLFNLVSVGLVVSLNGNSPIEKQRAWRFAVFPTSVSGVGCHFINIIINYFFISVLFFILFFLLFALAAFVLTVLLASREE